MLLRNMACCPVNGMFGLTLIKNVCSGNPCCGLSESEVLSFSSAGWAFELSVGILYRAFFPSGSNFVKCGGVVVNNPLFHLGR